MPTSGKMELNGVADYLEALAAAGEDVNGVARDALFEVAQTMQEEMQGSVPILTGRLHNHILIDGPHTDGNYITVEVGIIHSRDFTPKDVAIQANVIEYGSARQEAQPFLRPVFRKAGRLLKAAMKKVAGKYGLET